MARRLYYQDSYGRVHQARSAGYSRGLPASPFTRTLMLLALVVVLASLAR